MSNRILFPLISYIIKNYIFFDLITIKASHLLINHTIIILLIIININYFNKNIRLSNSILIIFFLNSYILLPIRFPLYNDLLTIFMMNMAIINIKNFKSYIFLILAFLSHEIAIFATPFIYLIRKKEGLNDNIIFSSLTIIFMVSFYIIHKKIYSGYNEQYDELTRITYSFDTIYNHIINNIEYSFSGIFFSFKIIWVILILNLIKSKKFLEPINLYFIFILILTYFYSTDHTRHAYLLLYVFVIYNFLLFIKNDENNNLLLPFAICQLVIPNHAYFAEGYIIHHFPLELILNFKQLLEIL